MATRTSSAEARRIGVLRFRDLGSLAVDRDGEPIPLGGGRLVGALTLLLVHADRVVSVDALAEAMWGGKKSPRSSSTLDSHIWRLRNLLEPGRTRGEPATVLLREPSGYRLVAVTEAVDSTRFAVLADETLSLLTDGQHTRALRRAEEALGLWRGRPFAAFADEEWARPAVARLDELRSQVRERQVEALLALDDPERALLELLPATADEPLREHLWALRMLAYQRSGRTDRALVTYQDVRKLLLDELGLEPGAELRELQSRILARDPSLAGSRPAIVVPPARAAPEVHLPSRLSRMIGRDRDRDGVAELTATHRLVTVVGVAGCGKTRLAIDAAQAVAADFLDGVWAVDLTAARDGDEVVATLTSALGLALPATGSARDALRSFSRDRRMLLLLDNCEHVLDAVADVADDLLTSGSELSVLATSREPLNVDGEVVWLLDPLPVPEPGATDPHRCAAVELFLERLGAVGRPTPVDDDLDRVVRICQAVDGVPLAIELAAARARAYSLDEILAQVSADASALSRIGRGTAEQQSTVRATVERSYQTLTPDEARLHRVLSVVPGPVTAESAAALVGRPVDDVRELLARLVHCSLLVPLGPTGPGRPSRFAQLAIVRGQAAHAAADERDDAVAARDRWVATLVTGAPRLGGAGEADWFCALDDNLAALRATLAHTLVDTPSPLGVQIASRLGLYWFYRGMMVEARRWQELALVPKDAEPLDRSVVRLMLGGSLTMANRADLGVPLIEDGWAIVADTPAALTVEYGDALAVIAGALSVAGRYELGRRNVGRLEAVAAATTDPTVGLMARLAVMLSSADRVTPQELLACGDDVYARAESAGNTFAAWMASDAAAEAALTSRDVVTGMVWSDRMVAQHRTLRVREGPSLLERRADLLALAGDATSAVRLFSAARAHNQRAGMRWPLRAMTADLMDEATTALDRVDFEEAWQDGARLTLDDLVARR